MIRIFKTRQEVMCNIFYYTTKNFTLFFKNIYLKKYIFVQSYTCLLENKSLLMNVGHVLRLFLSHLKCHITYL